MLESFLSLCKFFQYVGAAILFGSSLLLLYSFSVPLAAVDGGLRWSKQLLLAAVFALVVATLFGFVLQTIGLAGSLESAMKPEVLNAALWGMDFGKSSVARALLAVLALPVLIFLPLEKRLLWICMGLGALICVTFAWMGHGAATEGTGGGVHLVGDIAHILAAAGWIGALVIFSILLTRPASLQMRQAIYASLASFSGVGTALVAVIIGSGLINSFFLVGWNIEKIGATRYGQVLAGKLVIFLAMLALAAVNRFRLAPALATALRDPAASSRVLIELRRSIVTETAAAATIIALVSWLGMLAPSAAQ